MHLREIENIVLKLSVKERAQLAEHLLESLSDIEGDVEEVWLKEAENRYQAYRRGELEYRPASKVMEDIKNKLK